MFSNSLTYYRLCSQIHWNRLCSQIHWHINRFCSQTHWHINRLCSQTHCVNVKIKFYAFWRHKDILIVYRSGSFCLLWSLLANFSFVLVQIHSAGWKIAANLSWVWSRLKKICTINKLLLVLSFSKKLLILCRVAAKIFVFVILRNL